MCSQAKVNLSDLVHCNENMSVSEQCGFLCVVLGKQEHVYKASVTQIILGSGYKKNVLKHTE